jgi:hypothetical protein
MHFVPRDKRRITPTGARLFCQLSRMTLLEADVNSRILKQSGNPTFREPYRRVAERALNSPVSPQEQVAWHRILFFTGG